MAGPPDAKDHVEARPGDGSRLGWAALIGAIAISVQVHDCRFAPASGEAAR